MKSLGELVINKMRCIVSWMQLIWLDFAGTYRTGLPVKAGFPGRVLKPIQHVPDRTYSPLPALRPIIFAKRTRPIC